MLKYALLFSIIIPVWSQADPVVPPPPAPPACLSAPQTQGSVTLSCTAIDNSPYGVTFDTGSNAYILQVKATTTDPDTIALRISLTWQLPTADPKQPYVSTRSVCVSKIGSAFYYTFSFGANYDQSVSVIPVSITSIQVQELKASSSQTF